MMFKPEEERRVLQLLAEGNELAFTRFYDLYHPRVYAVAVRFLKSKELAEEVVQEVFLKVWMRRETMIDVADFERYVFTIARNLVFDMIKNIAREAVKKKDLEATLPRHVSEDESLVTEDYHKLLEKVVESLPSQQRQVFRLARVEGLSHETIANHLHISRLTVKAHMAKALQTIRQSLQHHIVTPSLTPLILGMLTF